MSSPSHESSRDEDHNDDDHDEDDHDEHVNEKRDPGVLFQRVVIPWC